MYLRIAVANCTGAHSFFVLKKRVKNYMRSTMTNKRLNALPLNIEADLLISLNMDSLINDFAIAKAQKKIVQKI